jgi:hypothetical protein
VERVSEAAMARIQRENLADLYLAKYCAGEINGLISPAWTNVTVSYRIATSSFHHPLFYFKCSPTGSGWCQLQSQHRPDIREILSDPGCGPDSGSFLPAG